MKLGLISDTHDQLIRTAEALRLLEAAGATQFLHCGDVTRPPMIELFAGKSAAFVFGNNDERHATALRAAAKAHGVTCLETGAVVTWAGVPIAVTHGHRGDEVQRLLKLKPRILCMGHTHQRCDEPWGAVRLINPGALHRAGTYTVAVLDLSTAQLEWIEVPRTPLLGGE